MDLSIHPTQSNTRRGFRSFLAAVSMVGKEGLLSVLSSTGLTTVASAADLALFLIIDGDATRAIAQPLDTDQSVRIRLKGACSRGDKLVLSSGADLGKVEAYAAQTGRLFCPGIAEEDGMDGQLVLVRPFPRFLTVEVAPTAFSGAAPVTTAPTNTTPYGFVTSAQAAALVANVNDMRNALIARGIMS